MLLMQVRWKHFFFFQKKNRTCDDIHVFFIFKYCIPKKFLKQNDF